MMHFVAALLQPDDFHTLLLVKALTSVALTLRVTNLPVLEWARRPLSPSKVWGRSNYVRRL